MAISITTGAAVHKGGTFQSVETLTQSTATAEQSLDLDTDVSHLGVGTATLFTRNKYLLASTGVDGMEKIVLTTGTGEAKLRLGGGTATGAHVFQSDTDMLYTKLINGQWMVLSTLGATIATST